VSAAQAAGAGVGDYPQADAQGAGAQSDASFFRALAVARLKRICELEALLDSCKTASTTSRTLPLSRQDGAHAHDEGALADMQESCDASAVTHSQK
jgi:hypothetical protein